MPNYLEVGIRKTLGLLHRVNLHPSVARLDVVDKASGDGDVIALLRNRNLIGEPLTRLDRIGLSHRPDADRLEQRGSRPGAICSFYPRAGTIYRRHRRRPNPPNRNTMTKMTTMIAVVDICLLPSGILGQARSGEPHLALPRLSPTWLDSCFAGNWRDNKLTETSNLPAEQRSGPPVLVVEDDREQRETLCAMLELEGFRHAEAANGREALDYLNESRAPCLVLLDLEMPVMNGWEFRENQLADQSLSRIPVVVVTANDEGLGKRFPGVEGFLWKPLRFEKLVPVLDRLCCRKKKSPLATTPAAA